MRCPICGAEDSTCGGAGEPHPVEILPAANLPRIGEAMIRVRRADGRLFEFQEQEVVAFVAANPGSEVLGERGATSAPTVAELAASGLVTSPRRGRGRPPRTMGETQPPPAASSSSSAAGADDKDGSD